MIPKNLKERIFTSLFLFFLLSLVIFFDFIMIYSLIVLGTLSLIEFLNLSKKILKNSIILNICNLFFIIYISIFCLLFLYLFNFIELKLILFTLLLGCIASDVGGFVVGKILQGPRLTKISPKKTISGAIGSFIFSLLSVFLLGFVIESISGLDSDFSQKTRYFVLALIFSLAAQIGDLTISYLKRLEKIKDTGKLLPGHGGIFDRIDSLMFVVIVAYILYNLKLFP